jgi:hypothetical protein
MRKFIVHFLLIAIVFLVISFAVVGYEGDVTAFALENRWTANRLPHEKPLRYVLLSNPGPSNKPRTYERRHFGWPLWVLYVDSSTQDGTWYAKLDVYKLAANFAAACVPSLAVAVILGIRRLRRNQAVEDVTQA